MHPMLKKMSISELSSLRSNIAGMMDAGNDLLKTLEQVKTKPHVLDDSSIAHMKRVYTEQREEIKLYKTLSKKWSKEHSSTQQNRIHGV